MAEIKDKDGKVVDDTDNPVALAYYRREPDYEVVEDTEEEPSAPASPVLTKPQSPPAPSVVPPAPQI